MSKSEETSIVKETFYPSARQYKFIEELLLKSNKYSTIAEALIGYNIKAIACEGHLLAKTDATQLIQKLAGRRIDRNNGRNLREIMRLLSDEEKEAAVNKFLQEKNNNDKK